MEPLQDIHKLQQEDETVGPVLEAMEAAKKPSPYDWERVRNRLPSAAVGPITLQVIQECSQRAERQEHVLIKHTSKTIHMRM